MFRGGVPIILRDLQPSMNRLHFAAGVDARPTGGGAELIEDVLAQALLRVVAEAAKKPLEAWIGCQSRNEFVDHGGNRIVPAEPLIKRLRFLGVTTIFLTMNITRGSSFCKRMTGAIRVNG